MMCLAIISNDYEQIHTSFIDLQLMQGPFPHCGLLMPYDADDLGLHSFQ